VPENPLDFTAPAGQKPRGPGGYIAGGEPVFSGPTRGFFDNLKSFLQRYVFIAKPEPFKYWRANSYVLPAGNTWLDELDYMEGRRAWVIVNHQYFDWTLGVAPTAVDYVYCNSVPIQAVGQGLWIYANGGVLSNPVGWGLSGQRVHVLPGTPGTSITFIQYA